MEIKVWDFNQEFFETDNNNIVKMAGGLRHNSTTDKPTGVYFRWTYWLQKENTTIIRCVGESAYPISAADIQLTTVDKLEELPYLTFTYDPKELDLLLMELKK